VVLRWHAMLPMVMYRIVLPYPQDLSSCRSAVCTSSQAHIVALPLLLLDRSRHFGMQLAAMPHTICLADLPPEVVRQILAAAVHSVRMDHLSIVARNDDMNWPSLLLYLNLRGVCSRYVLCTCLQVMFDYCVQWWCGGRMPAFY
jgi:hypothetical protein